MDDYELAFLVEITRGGSIACRECGEKITFMTPVPVPDIIDHGGVEWDCNFCGSHIVSVDEYEVKNSVSLNVEGEIDRILDTIQNVNTDDEVEEMKDTLQGIKQAWLIELRD